MSILEATVQFSGGGGSSEGLRRAGFRLRAAANHSPIAIATHRLNHPDCEHFQANLMDVDYRMFPRTPVLWSSPSCVWHAPAGGRKQAPMGAELLRNRTGSVDRATAFAVLASAEVHLHDVIIVENVPAFAAWTLYRWWIGGLEALGYTVQEHDFDAVQFGAPQYRKRRIIAATRGVDVDLTVADRPIVPAVAILDQDPGTPLSDRKRRLYVADQIESIREPGPHLVTFRKHARALRADQHPLATVTAGGNHHGVAELVDGRPHFRMLTNRECARAQGFSDDYQWHGTRAQVKRQIGDAVAVPVAEFIGRRIADALGTRS